jgi:UDP-N-acetylmuramate dehydrogenase
MHIKERVPLAPLTTFGIGGAARFFVAVQNLAELKESFSFAREQHAPVLILGGGSNLLVRDDGFEGLVIKIEIAGVSFVEKENGEVFVTAGAGVSWDALVAETVEKNLWGLENLSGIPGTVGAAPVQNIGAYGAEVKDTLRSVEAYDTETETTRIFKNNECEFGYRTSFFKQHAGRFVIVAVAFALQKKDISAQDICTATLHIRAQKLPDLKKEGTAGSFFLNPIVSIQKAEELKQRYPDLPQFTASAGVKISLAWLLDKGLGLKGFAIGGARLFEKQPLVIAAARGASADDVLQLAHTVKEKIKKEYGIDIEAEVKII